MSFAEVGLKSWWWHGANLQPIPNFDHSISSQTSDYAIHNTLYYAISMIIIFRSYKSPPLDQELFRRQLSHITVRRSSIYVSTINRAERSFNSGVNRRKELLSIGHRATS
jgi:hypothetical protein